MKSSSMRTSISPILAGVGIQLILGTLYAWSVFRLRLSQVYPQFTAAQLSLTFTISIIFYCVGGFFGGRVAERVSLRMGIWITAAMEAVGLLGASFIHVIPGKCALLMLYFFFGIVYGAGNGLGYNFCVTGIGQRYPEKLGFVTGVLLMSYAAGSLFLGIIAERMTETLSIFTFFRLLAAVSAAVILLCSFSIPAERSAPNEELTELEGDTPGQMLSKHSFWIYFAICVANSSAGLLVINSAANISVFFGLPAAAGLAVSLFNSLSRPFTGHMLDRYGVFSCLRILILLRLLAGVILFFASRSAFPVLACLGLFLVGICYGGCVTAGSSVIRIMYGPRHFPVNYSLATFCMLPGSLLGPLLSGFLQDNSGGAFDSSFLLMVAMDTCAIILLFLMRRVARQEGHIM